MVNITATLPVEGVERAPQAYSVHSHLSVAEHVSVICSLLKVPASYPKEDLMLRASSFASQDLTYFDPDEPFASQWEEITANVFNVELNLCVNPVVRVNNLLDDIEDMMGAPVIDASRLKLLVYQAKKDITSDWAFAEGFIEAGGVDFLLDLVTLASGSTRGHMLDIIRESMSYVNGIDAVMDRPDIVRSFFRLLSPGNPTSVYRNIAELLLVLSVYHRDEGFDLIDSAARAIAGEDETKPYATLAILLGNGDVDVKGYALTLINTLIVSAPTAATADSLIVDLKDAGVVDILRNQDEIHDDWLLQVRLFEEKAQVPILSLTLRLEDDLRALTKANETLTVDMQLAASEADRRIRELESKLAALQVGCSCVCV